MGKNMQLYKENVEDILPLTPIQEGMLFHYLSDQNSKQYHVNLILTMTGNIDFEVIKKAWCVVTGSNEVLRSLFRWDKLSKPVQIILKDFDIPTREYDLRGYSPEAKQEKLKEISEADDEESIDISTNPIRIILCRTEENKCLMFITNHHILFDGWSNGIIYREFLETYHKLLVGLPVENKPKTKYKEFVKHLMKSGLRNEKAFWSNYLEDFDTKTILPFSTFKYNDPVEKTSVINAKLNWEFTENLNSFAKENGITPAAVFYCAWGILLQKYSTTQDVVFGTTVSGRNNDLDNIDNIVGLFINTVPLRIKTNVDDTVLNLLKRTRDNMYERKEYENTSLIEIITASQLENGSSLFDSIVVLENYPLENVIENSNFRSLVIEDYAIKEMTNYDLVLTITFGDSMQVNIAYNDKAFELEIMENLSKNFLHILNLLISDSYKRVCDVEFLCEEERQKVIHSFNNTFYDYQKQKLIHTLIEEQVEKTPNKTAVVCGGEHISYIDLNKKANCLAWKLKEQGIGRNNIVGILVRRSIDMLIGMLGAVKAGAAFLPIDPDYPEERIEYVLENSGCVVMLTQTDIDINLDYFHNVFYIDQLVLENGRIQNPEPINDSEDLIYLIYTSGSTGNPKGVMLTHRSVHNFFNGMSRNIDFNEDKAIVSVTTISFDIFILESLLALTKGLKIVLAREEEQRNPKLLDKLIIDNNADIIQATPSRMKMLLESGQLDGIKKLKEILIGGEPFPENLLLQLNEICTGRIYNMYGPTETTVWSTMKELSGQSEVLIGRPIDNTRIYILGKDLKPVPIGVVGEIYIGGDGLSKGYFKNPELTDTSFIMNPYDKTENVYKTGDLAKWTPNGEILFIGRNDTQVKMRGYRIELSEIEAQLRRLEGISETVVILKKNLNQDDSIWAFFVSSKVYTHEELIDTLSKKIPYYMQPSHFVMLPKLPMTTNGKIDKKILAQYQEECISKPFYQAPENETQKQLTDIWAEVLGISKEKIGISDRFFDIGGNSLNIVRVHLKINQLYPGKCEMVDLFSYNTIKALADFINGLNSTIKNSLSYEYIKFPQEYFCATDSKREALTLRFGIEKQVVNMMKQFAASEGKSYMDVLMAIYLYLISEVTGSSKVSIQVVSDKHGYNKMNSLQLDFEKHENLSEVLEFIQNINSQDKNSYELKQLLEQENPNNEGSILPLFYIQEYFDFKQEYSKYFDLALCASCEEESMLTLKYNHKRIQKDKAKEFIENYIYIMETIASQYRSENKIS